jgi:uncharacterized protein (TIGR03437 family)
VTITINDPDARRWGFEASPRLGSDASKPAGTMTPADANEQVTDEGGVQFATHTTAGTRNGTASGVTFEVDWTAPPDGSGNVVFYVAANAANGNGSPTGDRIYSTSVTLTEAASASNPAIQDNGVLNAASGQPGIVPGSWIQIKGTNLSNSMRTWTSADIVDGKLPRALDGVSVMVNGNPAFVYYISPTQINVQAPDDTATGPVNVVVTNNGVSSAPMQANIVQAQPALFLFDPQGRKYPAAIVLESNTAFSYLGPVGLYPTLTFRPAKPGDTISLYGTGFGPTTPATAAGATFSGAPSIASAVTATIGGANATVLASVIAAPGEYQINIVVPDVPDGDQPVVLTMNGQQTQSGIFVSVKR